MGLIVDLRSMGLIIDFKIYNKIHRSIIRGSKDLLAILKHVGQVMINHSQERHAWTNISLQDSICVQSKPIQ